MTTANHSPERAMPSREKGEKLSDFIGRFMPAKREDKSPKHSPRLAHGYIEAREQAKREKRT